MEETASSAAKRPRRFRMAEYEVTKMEGVDEDPEISFKVSMHGLLSWHYRIPKYTLYLKAWSWENDCLTHSC